jgi:hypothetical protein
MELEDPKDLRARVRKFLILTNERKQMSKTTIRKRIALTATSALFAGMLSVIAVPTASANVHKAAGDVTGSGATSNTQLNATASTYTAVNGAADLLVATYPHPGAAAVAGGTTGTVSGLTTIDDGALSKGLLAKDASSGTAQTATVLAGGVFASGQMLALKLMSEMKSAVMTSAKIVTAIFAVGLNIYGASQFGTKGVVVALIAFSCIYFFWMALLAQKPVKTVKDYS